MVLLDTLQESRQPLYLLFLAIPRHSSPNVSTFFKNVLTFLKNIGKKLRYEKSLQKFHQSITYWFTTSLCEPSSITEASPCFTKNRVVKLVNLGETRQVSHGETINQVVMKRWNLWRLFSYLNNFFRHSNSLIANQNAASDRVKVAQIKPSSLTNSQ